MGFGHIVQHLQRAFCFLSWQGSFLQTGIAVSSKLPRFSDMYTLRIESIDPKSNAARDPVEMTKSITKWWEQSYCWFIIVYGWRI